jgi:hypothetical protein
LTQPSTKTDDACAPAAARRFRALESPQRDHHTTHRWDTSQKWPALLPIFQDNLRRFIAGEPLRNLVDKELGY